jgi:sterol desaturase/sphingolipid hydroxylase (fatty acid hydroxylase superfamily)
MGTPGKLLEELYLLGEAYSKTSIRLIKYRALEVSISVVTALISQMSVVVMFLFCLMMLSLGGALWLGEILGAVYYGFLLVGGFYFIVGLLAYFFLHKLIKKSVSSFIIKEALQ